MTYMLVTPGQNPVDMQNLITGRLAENYFVVSSSVDTLTTVLYGVSDMDDRVYGLRHYSKWLIFSKTQNIHHLTDLKIDNVAALVPVKSQLSLQKEESQVKYDIMTLLWKPGGRQFSKVGHISKHAETILKADVFPNSRFGFNQQHLLVATNVDVDMVAAPLSRVFDREQVVDFTQAFYEETSRFVYKKPGPLEDKWWTYLAPLTWDVYLCLLAVFLAVCVIALVIDQIHPKSTTKRHFIGRLHVIWGFLSNLLRQARVIGGSWLFFTIIMAAVYSGNLIAFLTVNKDKIPFKSVEDLVAQTQYKWGVPGGISGLTLIKTSNQSENKRIWKGIATFVKTDPDVLSHSLGVHVNKVLAGHYAFLLGEYSTSYYFSNNCDVTTIPDYTHRGRFCFALPDNSPYTSKFSEGMAKVVNRESEDKVKVIDSGAKDKFKWPWRNNAEPNNINVE
ncbi:glutamate receptor ionotropic, kainate 2-like [Gigantopelta aegis]|uniref:glutamate receptor ionotropic, kainate 2-like n=1 Tax=Gigantopelta aegis TaxID=1735272 RepID=UPI001B887A30|nr:glutamate receptor ionotropic, kainate 2-like [Gigantopelta aegis]